MKTRTSSLEPRTSRNAGFTLMELVVVIAILSLVAAIVLPRFSFTDEARLRTSARSLSALIRYLGGQGASSAGGYRLHFNLTENRVTVGRPGADGEEKAPDDSFLSRPVLADGVTLADVTIPRLGRVAEGEVIVPFGPRGLEEFLVIHLKGKDDRAFTIFAYPQGGKVKVVPGYAEEDT